MTPPSVADRQSAPGSGRAPNAPMTGTGSTVPQLVRELAAWSWRLLVIAAAVVVLATAVAKLQLVFLPLFAALLATAVLDPPASWLAERGWPRPLAALTVVLAALAAVGAAFVLILPSVVAQLDTLASGVQSGVEEVGDWLLEGPLALSEGELETAIDRATDELRSATGSLASGVLGGALLAVEVLAGAALALVLTFFLVNDGARIWASVVGTLPRSARPHVREVGSRVWTTLRGFLWGTTLVALFDAVFIGLVLVFLGVPGALPLAVLVFFGAYIPIAGAVLTGAAAVLVALVSGGVELAVAVAVAVVVVQQIEGNVLQPLVVGRAVALHPIAILLAVAAGGVLAGVIGAFVATPVAAVVARAGQYALERRDEREATPAHG